MGLPLQLATDLDRLRVRGHTIEVIEDGVRYYIILTSFSLPDGKYREAATNLMLMTDYQYPASKMDMFWTDPPIHCLSGSFPQSADQFELYAGRRWQRWSWHYPQWDPAHHSVITHLEVVQDRLARGT